jgi:hypothetical protein
MRAVIAGGDSSRSHSAHPIAGLIGIAGVLEGKAVLEPDESLLNMTVGDVAHITERYADKVLMQLQGRSKPAPPEHRLDTLFDVLDPATRVATIAQIIDHLQDVPQYQLFWQETGYIIADLYDAANQDQQLQLIQFVGNAARTSDDFSGMQKFTGNRRSDALLLVFIDNAEGAVTFQHRAMREKQGMTEDQYLELVRTAQAVLNLVSLGSYADKELLDQNRQRIIRDLEALGL